MHGPGQLGTNAIIYLFVSRILLIGYLHKTEFFLKIASYNSDFNLDFNSPHKRNMLKDMPHLFTSKNNVDMI